MKRYAGSKFTKISPNITLGCISPEASDLLDTAMAEWEKHKAKLPERLTDGKKTWNPRKSVYSFAYWLIRWSGLVQPVTK